MITATTLFDTIQEAPAGASDTLHARVSARLKRIPCYSLKLVKTPGIEYRLDFECPAYSLPEAVASPRDIAKIFRGIIDDADREVLCALFLSAKGKPCGYHIISIGDLTSSIATPREMFKAAVLSSATSIILCHNHPSGDPTPSPEDIAITKRAGEAAALLGIELLDHVVLGDNDRFCSLREKGLYTS
jgi:DNA repair protein RadC